ncbi:hypothetical protein BDP27DRAFT_1229277 [Rhodocollybia butyracea]|uniref:Uncharacterized protein n=1 Tax=Rhodocollybia butyracea TaxID=206335 RepID=A0A9P5PKR5_9AGAR|nr:hypothetical protein BDP27DRAFT_1231476 [Rhodocollybia butyracea]KAF9065199.1 hypothetical protein BDP27DRAFT_1229277 [Rhodocollybia butyracea]
MQSRKSKFYPSLQPAHIKISQNCSEDRLHQAYLHLAKLIPGFVKTLSTATDDELTVYIRKLEKNSNLARGDDISRAKQKLADLINRSTPTPLPLLEPSSRSNRGFQHDATGLRLCPVAPGYNWEDPEVRAKIRNQDPLFPTNKTLLFRGLYSKFNANPDDIEKGFLRSGELVILAKILLTSSSSADSYNVDADNILPAKKMGKVPTKQNVAQILGISEVTPPIIAYVACMYHFALTDASSWDCLYNGFNYISLYDTIVDYFTEVVPGTKELLAWWNK